MTYYYLFAGDNYYPCGGMLDYIGKLESKEVAVQKTKENPDFDWYNIAAIDLDTGELVEVSAAHSQ
jgi:hypothetical protein